MPPSLFRKEVWPREASVSEVFLWWLLMCAGGAALAVCVFSRGGFGAVCSVCCRLDVANLLVQGHPSLNPHHCQAGSNSLSSAWSAASFIWRYTAEQGWDGVGSGRPLERPL